MMALALALACHPAGDDSNGGTDGDADVDTDADTDTDACTTTVTNASPNNGATDVAVDTTVVAELSEPVSTVAISLTAGTDAVSGTTTVNGSTATFTPDAALEGATHYVVAVDVCDTSWGSSFDTRSLAVDSDLLVGRTYDLDLDLATWVAPDVGSLFTGALVAQHMLVMVEGIDEDAATIDALGAAGWVPGESLAQYPCSDAADFVAADFTANPDVHLGPQAFQLGGIGFAVDMHDLEVWGRFSKDGAALEDARVEGLVDLRSIVLGQVAACVALPLLGTPCVACPDGEIECVESILEWASAPAVDGLTLDAEPGGC